VAKRTTKRGRKGGPKGIPALDLRAKLEKDGPAPAYAVVGADPFLRSEALAGLREALLGAQPGPSLTELEGRKADLAQVLDELRTLPFFGGGRRLVVVRGAGSQGQKQGFAVEHAEALTAFVQDPPPTATLVLEAAKIPRRTKAAKALLEAVTVVDCEPFDEAALLRFLRSRAERHGRPFARGADLELLERLGSRHVPLGQLDAEVRKLAAAGEGPIGLDEVEDLASWGSSEESFGLIDAVGRGDAASVLEKMHVIFRDGLITHGERNRDPSGIAFLLLGMLRWDLGRLFKGRALLERGARTFQITKELRVFRDKERFMGRLRRADREELGRRHELLRQADAAMKNSADPRGTLTGVLVRLARSERKGRSERGLVGGAR